MHECYLRLIRSFEGFTARAQWDYAQNSNGFGTRALYPGENIDRAEATRRFEEEISTARQFVERQAAGWDEGTKAALTSLTFNAGTRWASSGLGRALAQEDINAVREKFLAYTKAGGADLPGLARRRLEEATWIGNPHPPTASQENLSEGVREAANPRDTPASERASLPAPAIALAGTGKYPIDKSQIANSPPSDGDNEVAAAQAHISELSMLALLLELGAPPTPNSASGGVDDARSRHRGAIG